MIDHCISLNPMLRIILAMLICVFSGEALARESIPPEISLKYESELVEEVIVTAGEAWRNKLSAEAEWRRALKEHELKDGRFDVEFGYDSAYEEIRAERSQVFEELNESDYRPVSLLRIRF